MAKLTKSQEDSILKDYRAAIGEGIDHCEPIHSRWEENQRYTRGEQWSADDIARQERRDKPAIPWNDIFKVVHSVANREMVARLVPKVFGRNSTDEGVANILDEACRWQRATSESEHYESMAFRSAAICGYGVAHKFWDPVANDGEGLIRDADVPICEMLWPSRAREMNLADRRWHIRGRWIDIDLADEYWGATDKRISRMLKMESRKAKAEEALADTSDLGTGEAAPTGAGWGWGYVRTGKFMNLAKREVFVGEYEWQEVEYRYRAAVPVTFYDWVAFVDGGQPLALPSMDPQTQQPVMQQIDQAQYQELSPDQQAQLRDAFLSETEIVYFDTKRELDEFEDLYESVIGEEFTLYARSGRRVIKFAVVVNDKVAESGTRPYGWSYHFITAFPFETREGMEFYGIPDLVKGPQDYKNALISNMMAMYMSSPKGTLVFEKSAIGNKASEIADQLASPSGLVIVDDGTLTSERYKYFDPPNYPPMLGPLLDIANRGVENALGLDPISLGTQDDLRRVSGKVVQASQLASNVIVACLFDSMRKFRRGYGLCNVRFLRHMYDPQELIRIVGDEKAEDMPQDPNAWDDVLRYDITIDEQPSSPSELMETLDFLTRTGELSQMRARGDIQFEDQLELMPQIPQSIKRKILANKRVADQLRMTQQQMQQMYQMIQSMREFLIQTPDGQALLASFDQMFANNTGEQQAAQGPPQMQQQG